MASANWTGKARSTDLGNAGNWDNGVAPATVDAFIIGAAGTPISIVYASGTNSGAKPDHELCRPDGDWPHDRFGFSARRDLNQTGGVQTFDGNGAVSGSLGLTRRKIACLAVSRADHNTQPQARRTAPQ
jgi:hypothetical protein